MGSPQPFGSSLPPVALGARKGSAAARLRSARAAAVLGVLLITGSASAFAVLPVDGAVAAFVPAVLLVPLAVGAWAHAQAFALAAAGSAAARFPLRDLLVRPEAGRFGTPAEGAAAFLRGGVRLWGRGAVAMSAVLVGGVRTVARALGRGTVSDVVHVEVDPEAVEATLRDQGLAVAREGRRLVVQPVAPAAPGGAPVPVREEAVALSWTRLRLLALPEGGRLVRLRGPAKGVRRLRKSLEGDMGFLGRFAWSIPARRMEARLNAVSRDAARAASIEEVSTLLADVKAVQAALARRDFLHDDAIVLGEKAHRLRALLEGRLLSGPLGAKGPDRATAPGPALLPDVGRLVDAESGRLAAPSSLVYLPVLIVPFTSRLGGGEVVVSGRSLLVEEEGERLLEAVATLGCTRILESGRHAAFQPVPPVSPHLIDLVEAHLRERWGLTGPLVLEASTVEVLFVPHAKVGGALVSAVTGAHLAEGVPGASVELGP